MSDQRLLVDLDEAARRLSVSRRLVQALVYDGRLVSVLLHRRRLVAVSDLTAFVDELREEGQPGPAVRADPRAGSG